MGRQACKAGSYRHGGLAQLARAPALHAGGQRFESVILHQKRGGWIKACRCRHQAEDLNRRRAHPSGIGKVVKWVV